MPAGEGGLLALVPDPTVCFADARYTQCQDIHLAIENLSKVLKDGNFRDFIKQRDNAVSGGGMPD